jgi:hypothetical protein
VEEIKRIIRDSEIMREDDRNWPAPDKIGRQELEIKLDKTHISFTVRIMFMIDFNHLIFRFVSLRKSGLY